MDKNAITAQDMLLQKRFFYSHNPDDIPLSFCLGEREICGIPSDFHPRIERFSVDRNLTAFVVTGENEDGFEIRAEQLVYADFPATEWVAHLTNKGTKNTPIVSRFRIGCGEVFGTDPALYHSNGDICSNDGYETYTTPLSSPLHLASVGGVSCHTAFPYMRFMTKEYSLSVAVGWTGGWEADFAPSGTNGIRMEFGQRRCHFTLYPGETMRSPRVLFLACAGEDRVRAMNQYRRFYFSHILPCEANGHPIRPKCCMHVFMAEGKPEFTGASEKNQVQGIDDYLSRGLHPDVWWLDAGWYPCDYDWPRIGNWMPDPARFPNGLGPLGRKCEENGMQFLLWFEPERVRLSEKLALEHPEWVLKKEGWGDGLFNLGNPKARAYITDLIDGIIKEGHVSIYRQDFNFEPQPIWVANETEDRIGALENLHIQGYLAYWDALRDRNPGLILDSCASGGRRNDLDTMRRAVPLQYTDMALGVHPIKQKQHRLMFEWIPYFRAHNYNWDNAQDGSYINGGRDIDEYAYQVALAPALTDVLTHDAPESLFAIARKMHPIWRCCAELELCGDYYPLSLCRKSSDDWYAMQFDNPKDSKGFIQFIRNTTSKDESFTVRPFADPSCVYSFRDPVSGAQMQLDGKVLAEEGLTQMLPQRSGVIWLYTKQEKLPNA